MEELISILMSIYNEPIEWITKSVDSMLEQSYKNKELIVVVDNPSNKDAIAFLNRRKQIYNNLKVIINKENMGLVHSLNKGLELCSGTYIARMDADDYSYNKRLEKQISFMIRHNLDVVGCDVFVNNGELSKKQKATVFNIYCKQMAKYCTCLAHPTWVAKREVYNSLHGYREIDSCEDFDFLNRAVLKGYRIGNVPETLFEYRINEASISNTKKYKQYTIMSFLSSYYRQKNEVSMKQLNNYLGSTLFDKDTKENRKVLESEKIGGTVGIFRKIVMLRSEKYRRRKISNIIIGILKWLDIFTFFLYNFARNTKRFLLRGNALITYIIDMLIKITKKDYDNNICRFYVIGTEDYGNIGDHQIAISIKLFLTKNFPEIEIIEITASQYYKKRRRLISLITKNDIIFLTGGGNFGNVYPNAQHIRRDVIKFWKNNLKIVMPVTIYYDDNYNGRAFARKDQNIFTKDNNIVIATRETISYEIGKKMFNCDILLTPDIVLVSNIIKSTNSGNYALLCLRSDFESSKNDCFSIYVRSYLNRYFNYIKEIDTQKIYNIPKGKRQDEVNECLEYFRNADIVITDRLHGMIFSAITSTPCIAFGNYNHKVEGSYRWLNRLEYIKLMKDLKEFQLLLDLKLWTKTFDYDPRIYEEEFKSIVEIIRERISQNHGKL